MNTKTNVFDTTSTSTSKTTTAMFCTTSVPPSLYCRHFTLCLIKCLSRACVCAQSQSARTMHLCTCCVGMVLPLCCTLNLMRLALLLRLLYFAYGSYQAMFICLYTLKLALSQLLEFFINCCFSFTPNGTAKRLQTKNQLRYFSVRCCAA